MSKERRTPSDTRVAADGKTVEAWFEGKWQRVGELTDSGAGIPVTRVVPFTPVSRAEHIEAAEGRIAAALAYLDLPGPQMCCGICDEDRKALRAALSVHREP